MEILIEQIIAFELKRLGPFVRTTGYDKTKITKENIHVNYYLLKYCTRQCILLPHLGRITYKL